MIELGISVSLFVILFFGVTRIAIAFATKQHLEQAAQVGLDTMNRIANLEQGTFTNLTASGSCGALGSPASTKCPGMLFVTDRVKNLITRVVGLGGQAGTYHVPLTNADIEVGYQPITTLPPTLPGALEDRVWVRIRGFQPGAINLASVVMSEKSGPYLYQGLGTGFSGIGVIKNPFGIWDAGVLLPLTEMGVPAMEDTGSSKNPKPPPVFAIPGG